MQLPYRHGRYILLEAIARGGMAEVYRAKYVGPEGFIKDVAVKRILPEWSKDREFITLLIDEARALMQLQHQNIVHVFELGIDAGVYFLAMEYVGGPTLRTLTRHCVDQRQSLPEKFAYFVVMEVLKALAFAHSQVDAGGQPLSIVHRDISPQNILLSWQGEVKVADFGIAKGSHRSDVTVGAHLKGKYAYMSPEQARGEVVDRRTDIFATGSLLFELLTGRQLFDAPNDLLTLERVRTARLPSNWEKYIHPAVRPIMRSALSPSLDARYATAAGFLSELNTFVTAHRLTTHSLELATYVQNAFPDEVQRQLHGGHTPLPDDMQQALRAEVTRGYTPHYGDRKQKIRQRLFALTSLFALLGLASPVQGMFRLLPRTLVVRTIPPPIEQSAPMHVRAPMTKPLPVSAKGTLVIRARPWGHVTVPGIVTRKESPVRVSLKEGEYPIRVQYLDGKQLTLRARVASSNRTVCNAVFAESPRIWCTEDK